MNSLRKHKVTPHQRDTYYLDLFVHKYMFCLFGDLWHFFPWFWGFEGFASSHKPVRGGVGGERKIVAKRDPSVCNSAWESIFQMNVDYHCPTWKLGYLNISEYLARYDIQMDASFSERSWQSGKKPILCMLGLLSTIIRGRERADQKSATHGKIALAHEHNWALITSICACGVARTSARRLGQPAPASFFKMFLVRLPFRSVTFFDKVCIWGLEFFQSLCHDVHVF